MYDNETEVLTSNGYKLFKDVKKNDGILTYDWSNREEHYDYDYKLIKSNEYDNVYHLYDTTFDLCITGDHVCFVKEEASVRFYKLNHLNNECYFYTSTNNICLRYYTGFEGLTVEKIPYTGTVYSVQCSKDEVIRVRRKGISTWNGDC